jgi:hypothetical protein
VVVCPKHRNWQGRRLIAERIPPSLAGGIGRAEVEQTDPVHLARLLRLGGERRHEKAQGDGPDESPSVHGRAPNVIHRPVS